MATAAGGYRLSCTDLERGHAIGLAQAGLRDLRASDGALCFSAEPDDVAELTIALGEAQIGITELVGEKTTLEELFLGLTEGDAPTVAEPGVVEATV